MYTTDDFVDEDKTNFKCFKFPNGNIYYGEIAYVNDKNEIIPDPEAITDEEEKAKIKLVRHGIGCQLYGIDDVKCDCKYEGSWEFDKKKGKGCAHFQDGSIYQGEFTNDLFEGMGKFVWKAGHVYIGNWKKGKMEGIGEFKHKDGHILHGEFINNYMLDKELNNFVNPFLPSDNLNVFKEQNCLYQNLIEVNQIQFTDKNVKLVYDKEEIASLIEESINNNLTPLIIRTVEKRIDKNNLFNLISNEYIEIDLKYYYLKLRKCELVSPQIREVYNEIKEKFMDAFINGKLLILNFDDCQETYNNLFDPSIKEIYGNYMFNPLMWTPKTFFEGENFLNHVHGNKDFKLHENFRFIVYSRFLIEDVSAKEEEIKTIIENRFGKDFPLQFINCIVFAKKQKEVEPVKEEEKVENEEPVDNKKKPEKK
jgi:hypothetical protein